MDVAIKSGKQYHYARAVDTWILSCDLGQSNDPTAICALNHRIVPLGNFTQKADNLFKQNIREHFDVLHLERLPLGMPYPTQVERVAELLRREPLIGADLVIDETGVGRAVGDIFDRAGLRPNRVTITAGLEQTQQGCMRWHVAKGILMSTLEARMHTEELRIAPNISDAGALKEEMRDFQRKVTEAGRATWAARTGAHDDLVLAVAIAVWFAKSRPLFSHEPFPF